MKTEHMVLGISLEFVRKRPKYYAIVSNSLHISIIDAIIHNTVAVDHLYMTLLLHAIHTFYFATIHC